MSKRRGGHSPALPPMQPFQQTVVPGELSTLNNRATPVEPDHFFGTFFDKMRNLPSYGSSEFAVGPALFSFLIGINAKTVIEIGRFTGFSTMAMAGALRFLDEMPWVIPDVQKQRPDVDYVEMLRDHDRHIISIDPDHTYGVDDLLRGMDLGSYVDYIYANSHGLDLGNIQVDFVFIDGDHSLEGLRQDVSEYVGKYLRPGGYFALHDYYGWYDANGQNGSPIKTVVDEIGHNYQHILIDTGFMSLVMFRKPPL